MTRFVRLIGAVLGTLLALGLAAPGESARSSFDGSPYGGVLFVAWILSWLAVGYLFLPYLTIVPAEALLRKVRAMSIGEFLTAVAGLLIGLLMGLFLAFPLSNFPAPLGRILPIGVSAVLGLGMLGLAVAKRHDLVEALENAGILAKRQTVAPPAPAPAAPAIVVDTSSVIDGRLAEIAETGFLLGRLLVPRFVLEELQRIADHGETHRRGRGRRGLEILARLRQDGRVTVEVPDDEIPEHEAVDAKLVELARRNGAAILTTDYNLNRVAEVQGIRVLNVNALANAVKPPFLPGEALRVRVVQPGKEPGQGVAYLDDGTMIVVESGSRFLDHDVDVTVTRVLQTVAGRMVFANPRGQ